MHLNSNHHYCCGSFDRVIFPGVFAAAFTTDAELMSITERGIRIAVSAMPLVGFQIVSSSFFQVLDLRKVANSESKQTTDILSSRHYTLPRLWGLDGLWIAMPVSELAHYISLSFTHIPVRQLNRMESARNESVKSNKIINIFIIFE